MLSRTTILVLVGLLHASVNVVSIQRNAGNERAVKCMHDTSQGLDKKFIKIEGDPNKGSEINCIHEKLMSTCLAEDFDSTSGSTEFLDFLRAYYWLRAQMFTGCTDVNLGDLRRLVLESGILEREGLPNIEEVPFSLCAQESNEKCVLFLDDIWETVWAEHVDQLSFYLIIKDCLEKEAKTCKDPMMEHIVDYMKAFMNHLWKDDALLARMMIEDKQHEN